MRRKIVISSLIALVLCVNEALAKDKVAASFSWNQAQLSNLRFLPKSYRQTQVGLIFIDPRKVGEIENILFDPTFKPKRRMPSGDGGEMDVPDFFVKTVIRSARSGKKISETALCNWNDDKSVAGCWIEEEGGGFEITVSFRNNYSRSVGVNFVMKRGADYKGFRIAQEAAKHNDAPDGVEVEVIKPGSEIKSRITFK